MMPRGALALVSALVFVVAAGCANAPTTLVILQNQKVIPDTTTGLCTPTTDLSLPLLSGIYDVDLDQDYPYYVYPLVQSRLPSLMTAGGIERNSVVMSALRIEIQAPAGLELAWPAGCPATFDAPASLVVDPQSTRALTARGFLPCHAQYLRQLIRQGSIPANPSQPVYFTLSMKALASRDGAELDSDAFPFQVGVCAGCLQAYFPATPMCIDTPKPNPRPGNPCNPAQDGPQVLCCVDAKGALLCPAPDA